MALDGRLGWKGMALLAVVGLAACGGSAEREDEEDDRSPAGPSAAATPAPKPTPAPTPTPAGTPDPGAPAPQPTPTPAAVSVAYEQDIRPILQADCLGCHSQLASYAGTMGYVVAGNPNSALVRATQPGGSMNRYLSGDKAGKAELVRRWVVENGAAQSR